MRKTTKTAKTTKTPARRVRETTAAYRPRKAKATPAPAPEPASDWSSAFAAAKNAVVTDATRPIGASRTKQLGIGAALVGAGFGIATLLR